MGQTMTKNALTFVSSTETDFRAGNVAEDERGNRYIKCKAGGTIAVNALFKPGGTTATLERGYRVPNAIQTTAAADVTHVMGVNATGVALATGDFFWGKTGPIVTCVGGTTTAVTVGSDVYPSATAGEADLLPPAETLPDPSMGVALTGTGGAGTTFDVKMHRG